MKKVLLTLFAALMAVPAFAIEVYNNGDNAVEIYGHVHGYMGYGLSVAGDTTSKIGGTSTTGTDGVLGHSMLYGLQGNTRVGTRVKLGSFSGQFEIGANEKTMVNQGVADPTKPEKPVGIGIRQAWGAYTFGNGSRLLVGKTDTPTVMNFISSFYDTDGGLNGFGGSPTGFRRFQVQYSIAGLTLALIEDDVVLTPTISGFTVANGGVKPYTPRAGLSYVFQNESLLAKIAATYTAINGTYTNASGANTWGNIHAFGVVLGVKPTFGNMYVSVHARYGMNEDLYGEGGTYANAGSFSHSKYNDSLATSVAGQQVGAFVSGGTVYNVHRAGAALEFGIKATENFTAVIGGGYQATIQELPTNANFMGVTATDPSLLVHSYAVFLQGQYRLSQNFALVPEVAWFGTIGNGSAKALGQDANISDSQSGLLVGLQFKASF